MCRGKKIVAESRPLKWQRWRALWGWGRRHCSSKGGGRLKGKGGTHPNMSKGVEPQKGGLGRALSPWLIGLCFFWGTKKKRKKGKREDGKSYQKNERTKSKGCAVMVRRRRKGTQSSRKKLLSGTEGKNAQKRVVAKQKEVGFVQGMSLRLPKVGRGEKG